MNKVSQNKAMINKDNIPQHVVIIPDGNRRWAKERKIAPWQGHQAGAKTTEKIIRAAYDLGIPCLSFWVGSKENLTKRPPKEISFLFKIYERYFHKLALDKRIHQNQVRVNVFGHWLEILPKKVIKSIEEATKATRGYNRYFLNFFIAYNGTDEMIEAIRGILKEGRQNKNLKVTPQLLKSHLWTHDLPLVDFLIRTGSHNDPHNSAGFMMWHCANSQLYFTKEFYPDFGGEEFNKAIKDFLKRQRRFGK